MGCVLPAQHMASETPSELTFPPLPQTGSTQPDAVRVCIVTDDLVGPIQNGGIGTANTALAEALGRAGFDVTILFSAGAYSERHSFEHWILDYGSRGIKLVPLPTITQPYSDGDHLFRSYEVFDWLRRHDFDVIHFHEWHGRGYYSCLAKQAGLAFANTTLCVTTHSPMLWHKLQNHESLSALWEIEMDFLERQSVKLCDVVVSPSQYMLRWLRQEGWQLPSEAYVQQNLLPPLPFGLSPHNEAIEPVREVVFFGRLEPRKGLVLVCDALDQLPVEVQRGLKVTFLGKDSSVDGISSSEYLHRRSAKWHIEHQCLTDKSYVEALTYLRQPGRLALMASLADNSPYTVLECLHSGIPFVATRIGGIPDLIADEDHDAVLFAPQPEALAQRLEQTILHGIRRCRPRVDVETNEQAWLSWHRAQVQQRRTPPQVRPHRISLCLLALHDGPDSLSSLRRQLASIAMQTHKPSECLLAVRGLDEASVRSLIRDELGEASQLWQVLAQPNLSRQAAQRWALEAATGEYLLLLGSALADARSISVTEQAVAHSTATVMTWLHDEQDGPQESAKKLSRRIPLGACVAAGLFRPCFGGPDLLIRRDALRRALDDATNDDEQTLLTTLVLGQQSLQVLPEVLTVSWPGLCEHQTQSNIAQRATERLRPYQTATPSELWPALLLARSLLASQHTATLSPNMMQVLSELLKLEHELRRYPRLYETARMLFQRGVQLSKSVLGKAATRESALGH